MSQNVAMQPVVTTASVDIQVAPTGAVSNSEAMQPKVNYGALSVTPPGA